MTERDTIARGRQVDVQRAAELLAQGLNLTTVAQQLGCARSTLSRRYNRDPDFRALIAARRAANANLNAAPRRLRCLLIEAIEREVRDGNVRVILWLAERLKLLEDAADDGGPLAALLQGLSDKDVAAFAALHDDGAG